MTAVHIRLVTLADLPAIDAIQQACYPAGFHEPIAAFASKLQTSPHSSWLAEHAGRIVGYFFTHPWSGAQPPKLGQPLPTPAAAADTHFWHDLAVLPQSRGNGVAPALVQHALAWGRAHGFRHTRLVAVLQAEGFWQRWGFEAERNIEGYGDAAVLMRLAANVEA
ncbi:GNAT family N-acetyltransferase [Amantichitinum ursilacus]|uniref:Acetyltransferase (GNAT) family protein n=1 Tax=Amantichitinum ursilacus TaxID=857265 RepID=A0A0N0XH27_9NEIS|nr:GNAT family N-acetyltransferase [Amantichitinum ursilacus]KPC50501.1 Acetyltransferase (GNAT) family protein [Amantichitinum ursilacus]